MKAWNATRDATLAERGSVADNIWTRGRGLLGTRALSTGSGLLIRPCSSIHSFFMRYPFDAIFISREGAVLHLVRSMKPFRLSRLVFGAHAVLELPAGTIDATGTQIGDVIQCFDDEDTPIGHQPMDH
ncbi:MAG TPA: DUF192 domain-containing protein [Chloroflexota bacterium]|nr:DUF192 domain-containing protein [Chloroflexota bacterium]